MINSNPTSDTHQLALSQSVKERDEVTHVERRQIHKVLMFDHEDASFIDWNKMANHCRLIGANWEVETFDDGSMSITMFWTCNDE